VKPERHGIVDFTAINKDTGAAVPVTSNLRRVPALWNILSDAGRTVGFVGWWASFPAEKVNGYIVSDRIAYQLFGVKADDITGRQDLAPRPLREDQAAGGRAAGHPGGIRRTVPGRPLDPEDDRPGAAGAPAAVQDDPGFR
jgi:hypothetical protein